MTEARKLSEIAKTIRSKNAGVDKVTFDVILPDRATYDRVRKAGVLSRDAVCRIFGDPSVGNNRPCRIRSGAGHQIHDSSPLAQRQSGRC